LTVENERRESDHPNSRIDEVGRSGVYPPSGAEDAPGDAKIRTPASWGHEERDAAGEDDQSAIGDIRSDNEEHPLAKQEPPRT